jgi:hypothetical protein
MLLRNGGKAKVLQIGLYRQLSLSENSDYHWGKFIYHM